MRWVWIAQRRGGVEAGGKGEKGRGGGGERWRPERRGEKGKGGGGEGGGRREGEEGRGGCIYGLCNTSVVFHTEP